MLNKNLKVTNMVQTEKNLNSKKILIVKKQ